MLIDEFLCKREVLGKRAPHSFTPPLSVVGVSNMDRGGEYISNYLRRFFNDHGIHKKFTRRCTPQQNEVSGRKKRTVMEMARIVSFKPVK
jgi:hypothetical protein